MITHTHTHTHTSNTRAVTRARTKASPACTPGEGINDNRHHSTDDIIPDDDIKYVDSGNRNRTVSVNTQQHIVNNTNDANDGRKPATAFISETANILSKLSPLQQELRSEREKLGEREPPIPDNWRMIEGADGGTDEETVRDKRRVRKTSIEQGGCSNTHTHTHTHTQTYTPGYGSGVRHIVCNDILYSTLRFYLEIYDRLLLLKTTIMKPRTIAAEKVSSEDLVYIETHTPTPHITHDNSAVTILWKYNNNNNNKQIK
eukprot:GHVR01099156.1.p1 GENE.GHVR01099156.1~~GHVR01099156.1.p1  ORF type:complete len:259 (+),score=136.38 GHVR01099156.1:645-1421(+)